MHESIVLSQTFVVSVPSGIKNVVRFVIYQSIFHKKHFQLKLSFNNSNLEFVVAFLEAVINLPMKREMLVFEQ